MADNQLPVQIVILPPDPSQVSRTMASIQQQVESQGRKLGQAASRTVSPNDAHIKAYYKNMMAMNKAVQRDLQQSVLKSYKQQEILSKAHSAAILEDQAKSAAARLALEKSVVSGMQQSVLKSYKQQEILSKAHSAAIIEDIKRSKAAEVAAFRRAEQEKKAAAREAYAGSPAGIYDAAGIKGPEQRTREAAAVRAAQKQLNADLKSGAVTLGQYNVLMGETEKRLNLIESGNVRARGAIHKFTAQLASLTFELTGAIYGIGILATTLASPMLFGINFLRKLEDSKLGIASIIMSMGEINGETVTFEQAMGASNKQMDLMAKESINLSGKLEEFATTYRSIIAPGLAAGMNLDQIRKIAIAGTVAVKTIGLDSRQIVQEIRDLVAGGIQAASSTLATSLGLTDSDIKRAKLSSEGLFAFLERKLEGFVEGAKHRTETLSGRMEQVGEIITQGLGKASEDAFKIVKKLFDEMASAIAIIDEKGQFVDFRPEFIKTLKTYIDMLGFVIEKIASLIKFLWQFKEVISVLIGIKVAVKLWGAMTTAVTTYRNAITGLVAVQTAFAASTTVATGAAVTFTTVLRSISALGAGAFGLIGLILFGAYTISDYLGFFDTAEDKIRKLKELRDSESKRAAEGGQVYDPEVKYALARRAALKNQQKELNEEITASEGAVSGAEKALKELNNEFLKGKENADKLSSAYRTYTDLLKKLAQLESVSLVGSEAELEKQRKKINITKSLAQVAKIAFEDELRLDKMRRELNSASTKEDKAKLQFEIDKEKKLQFLRGEEFYYVSLLKTATSDVDAEYKKLIETKLKDVQVSIVSEKSSKLVTDSLKEQRSEIKALMDAEEAAMKMRLDNAESIRKLKGQVTYTPADLYRMGTEGDDVGSPTYGFNLPSVTGLNTSSSGLASNELMEISLDYDKQRIELAEKYAKLVIDNNENAKEYLDLLGGHLESLNEQEAQMKQLAEKQYEWSTGAASAFEEYNNAVLNSAQHAKDVWGSAFKGMEDGLVNFIKTGKFSFRDFAGVIIDQLIRIQAQRMTMDIFGAFAGGFSSPTASAGYQMPGTGGIGGTAGGFSWGSDYSGFAKGGAFTNSIVNSPTMFRFAKGTGLMGEAGPEAIMPLTRTTSGDLGVQVTGGAGNSTVNQITVHVSVSSDGKSNVTTNGTADNQMMGKLIGQAVQAEIIKLQRPGGILSK